MKLNKWTVGLAAVGLVSLASAAKAEENLNFLQTAFSSTTISGYVDTSIEWTLCPDRESSQPPIPYRGSRDQFKQNGFNLNVVKLSIEKPLDETEWAAGYKVDLLFGPDATGYNTSVNAYYLGDNDFAIKQAYVALRAPVGNGIEFKIGTFDTIIGYEVFEAGNNPNFTRSWGYAVEPTEHTGILGSYRVNDVFSFSAGLANTLVAGINNRNTDSFPEDFWQKTWMASIAVTAPESWGWAKGSTFYGGAVSGFSGGFTGAKQDNYYAGLTLSTPVTGLKVGAAFDYVNNLSYFGFNMVDVKVAGLYASYQATEKLSLHARGEYVCANLPWGSFDAQELTGTVQYDLWKNVISRLELRWDHSCDAKIDTPIVDFSNYFTVYANIIYKF